MRDRCGGKGTRLRQRTETQVENMVQTVMTPQNTQKTQQEETSDNNYFSF